MISIKFVKGPFVKVARISLIAIVSTIGSLVFAQTLSQTSSTSKVTSKCGTGTETSIIITYTWTVTDASGGKHTFSQPSKVNEEKGTCGTSITRTTVQEWSLDNRYFLNATGPTGSIDASSSQGVVNPKFVVVGVTYAPPGTSSFATYTGSTTVGNTVTLMSSFQTGTEFSVSVQKGINIPKGQIIGGNVTLTFTSTSDYTQSSNTSQTNTLSKTTSLTYKNSGYPAAIPAGQVSNDYDIIWLWLNPMVVATYEPAVDSVNATVVWQGYAYDPADPAGTGGADLYPVQVGYLDGHFRDNPSIDAVLARTWAASENLKWPSGQGPGLTATDKANILAFDPFTNPNYTDLKSLPATSADGRFSQGPFPPNPIPFTPGGLTTVYTLTQSSTQTLSQQAATSFSQAFGISEQVQTSFFNFFTSTTTFHQQQTFMWTHSTLDSLTTTHQISQGLSITGPPSTPTYEGPTQFIFYQDNLFGTFAFPPS